MNQAPAIGQFGAFDMENYGDLLYPIIFKKMFQIRGGTQDIPKYSFMGSESLQDSGYTTRPIQELFASGQEQLDRLIIGGGDVLRTDWDLVASHYNSTRLPRKDQSLRLKLRRLFIKSRYQRLDDIGRFRDHYMNYPAVGPFMINSDDCSGVGAVAYCSCGAPFPFGEEVKQRVAETINKSIFVYVRDQQTKNSLVNAGATQEIHVAPDLVVTLSDFFDASQEREKGRNLLQQGGVDIRRQILCLQSNPQPSEKRAEILNQLLTYQKRTGCEVVLIPVGRCHGDHDYLKGLAKDSCGAFKYIHLDSIFDMIAAMAASDVFIGTSMHGNITAFSFGIPHLFGPIPVAKCEGFLDVVNLPRELKLNSWSEVNQKLDMLTSMNKDCFTVGASAAKKKVNDVFDQLVQTVKANEHSLTQ